jgi:hypothetical protein
MMCEINGNCLFWFLEKVGISTSDGSVASFLSRGQMKGLPSPVAFNALAAIKRKAHNFTSKI